MNGESSEFEHALSAALARWEIELPREQCTQLRIHFDAMIETNATMNLTRITDPGEAAAKHYVDSLAPLLWVREREICLHTLLDIGTGAGFPAVPLAVARPDWRITAIDGTGKKVDYLNRAIAGMGITNLRAEHTHSSQWQSERSFDVVVARALAPLSRSLELCARFVAPGGRIVIYQTAAQVHRNAKDGPSGPIGARFRPEEPFPYDLLVGDEKLDRVLMIYRRR